MEAPEEQAPVQQAPAEGISADVVGNAFARQYYQIMHHSPERVHQFYDENSKLGRPNEDGTMEITTTLEAINRKILSLDYGEFGVEIKSVDSQESFSGGVLVLVTGYLTGKDYIKRLFTQTFFLAPQNKGGYFVLNDTFRYIYVEHEGIEHEGGRYFEEHREWDQDLVIDVEVPSNGELEIVLVSDQDSATVIENNVYEVTAELSEEVSVEEVCNPSENGEGLVVHEEVEEEVPVAEVVNEILDDSQMVAESETKIEEVPKMSYASIVKVAAPLPTSTSAPMPVRKRAEKPSVAVQPSPVAAPVAETPVSNSNVVENGSNPEGESEGYSIYIKGLPLNCKPAVLQNVFKQFGPIKSNGIQVRFNSGFCFGFVEFEVSSAVQSAIDASPIMIGDSQAYVEEKRSTRGNNRGRYPPGRGGGMRSEGRSEGPRGRGNYGGGGGGRGYGSRGGGGGGGAESGNRSNSRGGYSNRGGGGEGYQSNGGGRVNRGGGGEGYQNIGGGRVNRGGGPGTRNMVARVSAPA